MPAVLDTRFFVCDTESDRSNSWPDGVRCFCKDTQNTYVVIGGSFNLIGFPVGIVGAVGAAGIAGTEGAEGEPGQPGPQGPPGAPGAAGTTGNTGAQGPMGLAVFLLADAESGEDGRPGAQGNPGTTGAQGPIGPAIVFVAEDGPEGEPGRPGDTRSQNPMTVATPAVPASTVAIANKTGIGVTVYIKGGTLTVITVGGTVTGIAAAAAANTCHIIPLSANQTIAITYSVAPTWVWVGS